MSKKIDRNITTIRDFITATRYIDHNSQIYVQLEDSDSLVEITELLLCLPKKDGDVPHLILRAV